LSIGEETLIFHTEREINPAIDSRCGARLSDRKWLGPTPMNILNTSLFAVAHALVLNHPSCIISGFMVEILKWLVRNLN